MTQENVGPEAGYFKYFINTALQGNMVCQSLDFVAVLAFF